MAELAAAVTGQHFDWIGVPYPSPPIHAWVVKQAFPTNEETDAVIRKLLKGDEATCPEGGGRIHIPPFIPDRFQPTYAKAAHTIKLNNGSTIELKSAEQDVDKFASVGVNLIVVDEPIRTEAWHELLLRIVRRQGARILFNLTPYSMQMDYLDDLMQETDHSKVEVFYFDTRDNTHLSKAELELVVAAIPEELKETRLAGMPLALSGVIYHEWDNWVEPFHVPNDWTRYVVHDHGMSNPMATLWAAVEPRTDNIYLYKEYYKNPGGSNIQEVVDKVLEINANDNICKFYIDPFAAAPRVPTINDPRNERTVGSLYKEAGLPVTLGPRKMDQAGRFQRVMNTKAYIDKTTSSPSIFAFSNLEHLRKELRLYRWARNDTGTDKNQADQPHPKWDHLMYCMETMCSLRLKHSASFIKLPTLREHIQASMNRKWEGETKRHTVRA